MRKIYIVQRANGIEEETEKKDVESVCKANIFLKLKQKIIQNFVKTIPHLHKIPTKQI